MKKSKKDVFWKLRYVAIQIFVIVWMVCMAMLNFQLGSDGFACADLSVASFALVIAIWMLVIS